MSADVLEPASWVREAWWPEGLYQDNRGCYRFGLMTKLNRPTLDRCAGAIGRNDVPALVFDMYVVDRTLKLSRRDMAGVVADAWSAAEYPQRGWDVECWLLLFRANGYSHDGQAARQPAEPVTLYRGCDAAARFGMSWTTDLEMARKFAYGGLRGRAVGQVYTAVVEPEHLLAYIGKSGRDESEFVVDPRGLTDDTVTLLEDAQP